MSNNFKKILLAALAALLIIQSGCTGRSLGGYAGEHSALQAEYSSGVLYDFNFKVGVLEQERMTYLKNIQITTAADAILYAGLFGIKGDFIEQKDAYVFEYENQKLTVLKKGTHLIYENRRQSDEGTPVTDEEAIERGVLFVQEKKLPIYYESAVVTDLKNENQLRVDYINSLGGAPNYAALKSIWMDYNGTILRMEYPEYTYSKQERLTMMPPEQACKLLEESPAPFESDTPVRIDVKGCEVVYINQNHRIIPAYQFYGEMDNGLPFQCVISDNISG